MYTSQDRVFSRLRGAPWVARARHGLRAPPRVAPESYVGMYVLIGVLGGITAAILWVMLTPGF